MELMERVKAECNSKVVCGKCKLRACCPMFRRPRFWDIEAIRKALGAEIDGAVVGEEKSCTRVDGAVVEEIVVPEKWADIDTDINCFHVDGVAKKQNEIIDCLEKIAERINR